MEQIQGQKLVVVKVEDLKDFRGFLEAAGQIFISNQFDLRAFRSFY